MTKQELILNFTTNVNLHVERFTKLCVLNPIGSVHILIYGLIQKKHSSQPQTELNLLAPFQNKLLMHTIFVSFFIFSFYFS